MRSLILKRSVVIGGHKTSVSLEKPFWDGLKEIAENRQTALSELLRSIDRERENANLSSAIRVFVFEHYRTLALGEPARQPGGLVASTFVSDETAVPC
jgi:predicted DNA-binding ribbon-helix-helix protein